MKTAVKKAAESPAIGQHKGSKGKAVYDSFVLGQDPRCIVSTDSGQTQLNNNIMVIGGSGSGKTTSIVDPMLLHMENSNLIGVFTKKGRIEEASRILKKRGYKVHLLDFVHPESSTYGFDPLRGCKSEADVKSLSQAIISEIPGKRASDPFWENSAEELIQLVMMFVWKGYYPQGKDMLTAIRLLDSLHHDSCFDRDAEDWDESDRLECSLHYALRNLKKLMPESYSIWANFNNGADATSSSITSSTRTPLAQVFNVDIRRILANPRCFDFRRFLSAKTALFVYISPVNMAHHRFIGLFYQQVFKQLFEMAESRRDGILPYPVQVICDDFATGCRIPDFPALISIFRAKRIAATMLIQSESQLESLYTKAEAATIINNCDTLVYLGGMDLETCRRMSERINLPLDEVLAMPVGWEYFFRRGQRGLVTRRYDLYKDPVYLEAAAHAPVA